MYPEQKGKVSTQMMITPEDQEEIFLRYGALKPFLNTLLEAPQAICMQFENN